MSSNPLTMMPAEEQIYAANKANAQAATEDYEAILRETECPRKTSEETLLRILADNADTEYGRRYGFSSIHSIEEYRKKVPVITYDDIAEDLERMLRGEKNILTAYPFRHVNQTSGTVGKLKPVPMTDRQAVMFLKYNRRYTDALLYKKLGEELLHGRTFTPAEGTHTVLPSGLTLGSASSVMAEYVQGGREQINDMLRTLYTSPVEASIPAPGTDTRYLHARFALADGNITSITAGFYSIILRYFQYIGENYEMLIRDIETGTIDASVEMPEPVRQGVLKKLVPLPERAAELKRIFRNGSHFPFVPEIWPKLRLICGIGKAGFSPFDETIKRCFTADKPLNLYSGITASEGIFSIPVELNREDGVLSTGAGFLEFLPLSAGDDFSQCRTADELVTGEKYEIIVTNFSGFYRYRMSDVVEVAGSFNGTPTVVFKYRRNHTVNLCGEKTTEEALFLAARKTAVELGFHLSDFTVWPDLKAVPPRYEFFVQPESEGEVASVTLKELSAVLEKQLREANEEYRQAIWDERIQPLTADFLQEETTFLYRDLLVLKGAPAGQVKPVRILKTEEQYRFFNALRLEKR